VEQPKAPRESDCHVRAVLVRVEAIIGLGALWANGLRAAVVVILVVVVVAGMREIDHRDHGESDDSR
jgi:hypothetical protein